MAEEKASIGYGVVPTDPVMVGRFIDRYFDHLRCPSGRRVNARRRGSTYVRDLTYINRRQGKLDPGVLIPPSDEVVGIDIYTVECVCECDKHRIEEVFIDRYHVCLDRCIDQEEWSFIAAIPHGRTLFGSAPGKIDDADCKGDDQLLQIDRLVERRFKTMIGRWIVSAMVLIVATIWILRRVSQEVPQAVKSGGTTLTEVPRVVTSQPPSAVVRHEEPAEDLLEGNTLEVELSGNDPEGGSVRFEYKRADNPIWRRANGNTVTFTDLPQGEFQVSFRAVDITDVHSEEVARTWTVSENPWNQWKEVASLKEVREIVNSGYFQVGCIALSPDGWTVAFSEHSRAGGTSHVPYPDGGTSVLSQQSRGTICRVVDGSFVRQLAMNSAPMTSVAFAPDGFRLVAGYANGKVCVWDGVTAELQQELGRSEGSVSCLAFGGSGDLVAWASEDKTLEVWRVSDGEIVRSISIPVGPITCIALSPNGRVLASGNRDGVIHIWTLPDGDLLAVRPAHAGAIICMSFDPTTNYLASGGIDRKAVLWQVSGGEPLRELVGHNGHVNCIAFQPGGETIATGSSDRSIRLWRFSDGRPVRVLNGHITEIRDIAFQPDGRTLVSCSEIGRMKLWSIDEEFEHWVEQAQRKPSVVDSDIVSPNAEWREIPDPFIVAEEATPERDHDGIAEKWRAYELTVDTQIDEYTAAVSRLNQSVSDRTTATTSVATNRNRLEFDIRMEHSSIEKNRIQLNLAGWTLRAEIDLNRALRAELHECLVKGQNLDDAVSVAQESIVAEKKAAEAAKAAFFAAMNNLPPSQWWMAIPEPYQGTRDDGKFIREKISRLRNSSPNATSSVAHVNEILKRIDDIVLREREPLEEKLASAILARTEFELETGSNLSKLTVKVRDLDELLATKEEELLELRKQAVEMSQRQKQLQAG
jgi:WD40 repeat protein